MSERKPPGGRELEPAGEALRSAMRLLRQRREVDATRLVALSDSFRAAAVGRFPHAPQVHESASQMGANIEVVHNYEAKNIPEMTMRQQLRAAVGEEHMAGFQALLQNTTEQAQAFTAGIVEDGWSVTMDKNIRWEEQKDPPILHFLGEMTATLVAANHGLENGIFSAGRENVPLIAQEIVQSAIDESKRLAVESGNPKLIITEFDLMRERIVELTDEIETALKEPEPNLVQLRRQFLILMRHQFNFKAVLGAYSAWMFLGAQREGTRLFNIDWPEEERTCRTQDALSNYLITVNSGERIRQRLMAP
ncbi:MAG: hypothetical protein AAB558_03230 [Patescibacteria group bacterium]